MHFLSSTCNCRNSMVAFFSPMDGFFTTPPPPPPRAPLFVTKWCTALIKYCIYKKKRSNFWIFFSQENNNWCGFLYNLETPSALSIWQLQLPKVADRSTSPINTFCVRVANRCTRTNFYNKYIDWNLDNLKVQISNRTPIVNYDVPSF